MQLTNLEKPFYMDILQDLPCTPLVRWSLVFASSIVVLAVGICFHCQHFASLVLCKALEMPWAGKVLSNTISHSCLVFAVFRCCITACLVLCAWNEAKTLFPRVAHLSASRVSYCSVYFNSTDHSYLKSLRNQERKSAVNYPLCLTFCTRKDPEKCRGDAGGSTHCSQHKAAHSSCWGFVFTSGLLIHSATMRRK